MRPKPSLTEGSIPHALIDFALPILAGNVLQSLNGSVNAVWIGRFLGEAAFAGVGNSNVVMFMLLAAIFGISMATTVLIAQFAGAGRLDEAKRVVGTSASFFLLLSGVIAALGFAGTPLLLRALHTPTDALAAASAYMRVIFLAFPFISSFFFVMAALRGAGDSRTPFVFLVVSVVLDIGLNPLLIFGVGPLPRLGVAGSATATLIAQASSLVALLVHLRRKRHPLFLHRQDLGLLRIDWTLVKALVAKGMPMGLQMFVASSSMIALTALVNRFGSEETAAFNAAMQLWSYVQMPALAIAAAGSSMVAQNIGAGRWNRVDSIAAAAVACNFLLGGALIALIYAADRHVLGWFLPPHGPALALAVHLNARAVWSFAFFGVSVVLFGVMRASGAVFAPLAILVSTLWCIRVPFAYLMVNRLHAEAIWWSFPLASIVSMIMALVYYRFGGWRRASLGIVVGTPRAAAQA
ncbi:MAG: MATE family efflux transporter [Gammaproteobacteria bacterium]|nr:MATE family efflux transporter [Gammaproteobacteria bacterium]